MDRVPDTPRSEDAADARAGRGSQRRPGRVGAVAGIGIYVHWTFLLLVAWIMVSHLLQGHGVQAGIAGVAFIGMLFACVLLHELGHALVGKHYGIRTRDITLYPIGGVARLERIPERPAEELLVALAGPAVNVAIAAVAAVVVVATDSAFLPSHSGWMGAGLASTLFIVNISLAVFNLIPAFPMDGGRVLRAVLAMRMDYVRATQIAATAGQVIAVGFGILGVFYNWFLLFIALFVYIGAQQESHSVQTRSILAGVPVRAAMVKRFQALRTGDALELAIAELLAGTQQDFPVVENGDVVGFLPRRKLLEALSEGRQSERVGDVMLDRVIRVRDDEMIGDALDRIQQSDCDSAPVFRRDQLVGMLTLENVGEWMMVQASLRGANGRRPDSPGRP